MYRSDLIREAMAKEGLTGEELAQKASISRPTVSHIINGKTLPTLDTLAAVAKALNIPLSELFVPDGEPKEQVA